MSLCAVITTIQRPTACVHRLLEKLRPHDAPLIVAGDSKGPDIFDAPNAVLLTLADQQTLGFATARRLPVAHYSRKNLAYLEAMRRGATCIYETDDDNEPTESWHPRPLETAAHAVNRGGWVNVYRLFSRENIWPRGFPLDRITDSATFENILDATARRVASPIQQGLANGSPDVDAIWRLVLDRPFAFENRPSVVLPARAWCPFNSQNTWWWPAAFPLLYLPSWCSFRMTDIWRSFIAQRCLWELDGEPGVIFHAPDVEQLRNPHDLTRDFADEVPGYTGNQKLVTALEKLPLQKGAHALTANLRRCYEKLTEEKFFPPAELELLDDWLADIRALFPESAAQPGD